MAAVFLPMSAASIFIKYITFPQITTAYPCCCQKYNHLASHHKCPSFSNLLAYFNRSD